MTEQVPFVQDEQKVQALAPQTTQEAFTAGIGARGGDRRAEDLDPGPYRHEVEPWAVFVIIVANKVARTLVKRRRFAQLVRHPGIGGMARYRVMDDPARREFDNHKDKNVPEADVVRL